MKFWTLMNMTVWAIGLTSLVYADDWPAKSLPSPTVSQVCAAAEIYGATGITASPAATSARAQDFPYTVPRSAQFDDDSPRSIEGVSPSHAPARNDTLSAQDNQAAEQADSAGVMSMLKGVLPDWIFVVTVLALSFGVGLLLLWCKVERNRKEQMKIFEKMVQRLAIDNGQAQGIPDVYEMRGDGEGRPPVTGILSRGLSIPRVAISRQALEALVSGINEFRSRNRGLETGYALVGEVVDEDTRNRRILVNSLIEAGNDVTCSGGHVKFDRYFQQHELERLQLIDPRAGHIGDVHLHPGRLDTCSNGDYVTDSNNVRASATQEMVFIVITETPAAWGKKSSDSLYSEGLKLDVFYMGEASGYEYSKVLPEIVDMPILTVTPSLRAFCDAAPLRTRLDFANLRRLHDYEMRLRALALGGKERLCVELTHCTRGFSTLIVFGPNPDAKPAVLVERNGAMMEYDSPFLRDHWTPMIWFTQIALAVEKELEDERPKAKAAVSAAPSRSSTLAFSRESKRTAKGQAADLPVRTFGTKALQAYKENM